jgi:hypothetical protein
LHGAANTSSNKRTALAEFACQCQETSEWREYKYAFCRWTVDSTRGLRMQTILWYDENDGEDDDYNDMDDV